jgi:hypothetical protein
MTSPKNKLKTYNSKSDTDEISKKVIPWRGGNASAPVGTIGDIWEMFCELGEEGHCCPPYLFVDKQYGIDQTVIAVHTDAVADWIKDEQTHCWDCVYDQLEKVDHVNLRGILNGRIKASEILKIFSRSAPTTPPSPLPNASRFPISYAVIEGRAGENRRQSRGFQIPRRPDLRSTLLFRCLPSSTGLSEMLSAP